MSDRRSFVAALREEEQARQSERLRPGAVHRIGRRLEAELLQSELPSRRRTWIPMVTFAAGAAMVLAVFTLGSEPDATLHEEQPAVVPMHASWQVSGEDCHSSPTPQEVRFDGRCRVVVPERGLVIDSRETTRLRPVEGGVALVDGQALFEVKPAPQAPPRRVEVPGGAIEVLGTRFSVVVDGDEGHVDLLEGSIRFVGDDGQVHVVAPGERYRFSSRTTVAAASEPSQDPSSPGAVSTQPELAADGEELPPSLETTLEPPAPLAAGELLAALEAEFEHGRKSSRSPASRSRSGTATDDELQRLIDQVADLRAQRQYRAAVSLLRGALERPWDRRTREVLSYELGTILSTQLPDRAKACAHWVTHREQFPEGRYARAIERAEQRLLCER